MAVKNAKETPVFEVMEGHYTKQRENMVEWAQADNIQINKPAVDKDTNKKFYNLTAEIDGKEETFCFVGDGIVKTFLENFNEEERTGLMPIGGVTKKNYNVNEDGTRWCHLPSA